MENYILVHGPKTMRHITLNSENMARIASDLLREGLLAPSHIMIHWMASIHSNSLKVNDTYFSYFNMCLSRFGVRLVYSNHSVLKPFYRRTNHVK